MLAFLILRRSARRDDADDVSLRAEAMADNKQMRRQAHADQDETHLIKIE